MTNPARTRRMTSEEAITYLRTPEMRTSVEDLARAAFVAYEFSRAEGKKPINLNRFMGEIAHELVDIQSNRLKYDKVKISYLHEIVRRIQDHKSFEDKEYFKQYKETEHQHAKKFLNENCDLGEFISKRLEGVAMLLTSLDEEERRLYQRRSLGRFKQFVHTLVTSDGATKKLEEKEVYASMSTPFAAPLREKPYFIESVLNLPEIKNDRFKVNGYSHMFGNGLLEYRTIRDSFDADRVIKNYWARNKDKVNHIIETINTKYGTKFPTLKRGVK